MRSPYTSPQAILPVRLPHIQFTLGSTETLPCTLERGLQVANALVSCDKHTTICRVANPTDRPVFWPKGHAFPYINPIGLGALRTNLIHMPDFDHNPNQPTSKTRDGGLSDDDSSDM